LFDRLIFNSVRSNLHAAINLNRVVDVFFWYFNKFPVVVVVVLIRIAKIICMKLSRMKKRYFFLLRDD